MSREEELEKVTSCRRNQEAALAVLETARRRVAKPQAWSPEHLATDASGAPVFGSAATAVAWNASAAVMLEAKTSEISGLAHDHLRAASRRHGGDYLFANTAEHALVLVIFEEAIGFATREIAELTERQRALTAKA